MENLNFFEIESPNYYIYVYEADDGDEEFRIPAQFLLLEMVGLPLEKKLSEILETLKSHECQERAKTLLYYWCIARDIHITTIINTSVDIVEIEKKCRHERIDVWRYYVRRRYISDDNGVIYQLKYNAVQQFDAEICAWAEQIISACPREGRTLPIPLNPIMLSQTVWLEWVRTTSINDQLSIFHMLSTLNTSLSVYLSEKNAFKENFSLIS